MGGERAVTTRRRERGEICCLCAGLIPQQPGVGHACERVCTGCLRLQAYRQGRHYEVVLNFQQRTGYAVQFTAADSRTGLSRWFQVGSVERLRQLLARTEPHAQTVADFEHMLRCWNRGSLNVYLTADQLVRILRHPPPPRSKPGPW